MAASSSSVMRTFSQEPPSAAAGDLSAARSVVGSAAPVAVDRLGAANADRVLRYPSLGLDRNIQRMRVKVVGTIVLLSSENGLMERTDPPTDGAERPRGTRALSTS
jgi:hypothetical protein